VVIKQTGYGARDKSIPSSLRNCWKGWNFFALFTGVIPILQWLPQYSPRRDLPGDIIAGFTVAIMNIPHGMAYGILAGVSAGNGLYMAVFPVLAYMFLGTSKHISIGTFAVASMMTAKVVDTYANVDDHPHGSGLLSNGTATASTLLPLNSSVLTDFSTSTSASPLSVFEATTASTIQLLNSTVIADPITKLEVATTLALTVGIVNVSLFKKSLWYRIFY